MHAASKLQGKQKLTLAALAPTEDSLTFLQNFWTYVVNLVLEELPLTAPELLNAVAYRATIGREAAYDLIRNAYLEHGFGDVPFLNALGDMYQLRPVKRRSLGDPLETYADATLEEKNGLRLYHKFRHVCFFTGTKRFKDEELPRLHLCLW